MEIGRFTSLHALLQGLHTIGGIVVVCTMNFLTWQYSLIITLEAAGLIVAIYATPTWALFSGENESTLFIGNESTISAVVGHTQQIRLISFFGVVVGVFALLAAYLGLQGPVGRCLVYIRRPVRPPVRPPVSPPVKKVNQGGHELDDMGGTRNQVPGSTEGLEASQAHPPPAYRPGRAPPAYRPGTPPVDRPGTPPVDRP